MYFDFEDYHPSLEHLDRALTGLEMVLLTIIFHLVMIIMILLAPKWMPKWLQWKSPPPLVLQQAPPRDQTRFVFVQPRVERSVPKAPDRAEASDRDRLARSLERAPNPTNPLPFSRGNTPERIDQPPAPVARGRGPQPDPAAGQMARNQQNQPQPDSKVMKAPEGSPVLTIPTTKPAPPQNGTKGAAGAAPVPGGLMGEALRNLQRSMRDEGFQNLGGAGGQQFGPEIQFDTKGVEFGPWLNRFIAQLRRNWYAILPYEAMLGTKGHVAITFNVHKTGALTDVSVVGPCPIDAFNNAAFGALMATNPTSPIPAAYPDEKAVFTVTFFYNETPPRQ